ncbi:MotE family protein [Tissierella carlieri]|uniref:MotE family protein n=1 Tax=Tissierella carlieri TaxID=689904 RepID=UPI0038694970
MEIANTEKNKKDNKLSNIVIILLISLIAIPLAIVGLIYNTNKNFKNDVNNLLSKMPGSVGEHFRNYPTEVEKSEKIDYLSSYFINLDANTAADKMYIIKKDDEKLYIDILRVMNSISIPKTEEIVLKIRNMELRKDLLFSLYDDAQKEEKERFLSEVSRVEKQDIMTSLLETEKRFSDREFLKILAEIKTDKLGEVLYYIDSDIRNYILDTFKEDKKMLVEAIIYEKTNEVNTLIDIAKVYETKPIDVAIDAIGNTNNYSLYKLGIIYKNLSVLKSAELLSNIKDEKFIEDLFASIMREEKLTNSDTNITGDISKAMEFLNEYGNKVKDLVAIYEKMSPDKVAKIVEQMIKNNDTITSFELSSEEVYELSDSSIIIDVLSQMKNQTLSKVLDFMEPDKASQITRLLAKPKNNN